MTYFRPANVIVFVISWCFVSAEDALDRFAMKRFYDHKLGGVTQPSQRK